MQVYVSTNLRILQIWWVACSCMKMHVFLIRSAIKITTKNKGLYGNGKQEVNTPLLFTYDRGQHSAERQVHLWEGKHEHICKWNPERLSQVLLTQLAPFYTSCLPSILPPSLPPLLTSFHLSLPLIIHLLLFFIPSVPSSVCSSYTSFVHLWLVKSLIVLPDRFISTPFFLPFLFFFPSNPYVPVYSSFFMLYSTSFCNFFFFFGVGGVGGVGGCTAASSFVIFQSLFCHISFIKCLPS